jgi:methyl-accepting chemotaxis protein
MSTFFTIKKKLVLSFIVLMAFFIIIVNALFIFFTSNMDQLTRMIDVTITINKFDNLLGLNTTGVPMDIEKYMLGPTEEKKAAIEGKFTELFGYLEKVKGLIKNPESVSKLEDIVNMVKSHKENFDQIVVKTAEKAQFASINELRGMITDLNPLIKEEVYNFLTVELKYQDEQKIELGRQLFSSAVILTVIVSILTILSVLIMIFVSNSIVKGITRLKDYALKISEGDLRIEGMTKTGKDELGSLAESFNRMRMNLKEVIAKVMEITMNLNSASKEIEAATQEQTTGANEHASGITEVSATLQELTITAKQITRNAGELVVASEEAMKLLKGGESRLVQTLRQIEEVGAISQANTAKIGELSKRSDLIGEMVEIIKDVSNKTNMLSINASIEASRAGEAGKGFSVVAAEIRELSKETLSSAKKVGEAGAQIQEYLHEIVISSESESTKVLESVKTVGEISRNLEEITRKIRSNTEFTKKIDLSIKQQESGSSQASETMKQMAEIARQSAETSRQTLKAVQDIVNYSNDLDSSIRRFRIGKDKGGEGDTPGDAGN